MNSSANLSFHKVSKEVPNYQLNGLDPTKATKKCDISTNTIKKKYDIFSEFLFANFNEIILTSLFQNSWNTYLNLHLRISKWWKIYKPVSILSIVSKIYERLWYKQLETYFELYLNTSVDSENDLLYWPLSFLWSRNGENRLTEVVILEHYRLIC